MSSKPGLAKQPDIPAETPNTARRFFGVFRYSKRALELVWATSHSLTYLLGYNKVRNYDGSWTEWGNSVRMPIETGPGGTV